MAATKTQLIGGAFQDSEGNILTNGYLIFELNQDEKVIDSNDLVCAGIRIKVTLNTNGDVDTVTPQYIWGNDDLLPVNSFYRVWGYTSTGQLAWGPNSQQVISGATFDVGTWIPNLLTNWNPPLTPTILETNGVVNGDQSILNLKNGTNVTITSDSNGGVTINSSASTLLQTNGVNNGSQSKLNLTSAGGTTLADDGLGDITISSYSPSYNPTRSVYGTVFYQGSGGTVVVNASNYLSGASSTTGNKSISVMSATQPNSCVFTFSATSSAFSGVTFGAGATALNIVARAGTYVGTYYQVPDSGSLSNCWFFPIALSQAAPSTPSAGFMLNLSSIDPTAGTMSLITFARKTGNWLAVCGDGAGSTIVDTGITCDTTPHRFEFFVNNTNVTFYIDSNLVATISTHIPSVSTVLFLQTCHQTQNAVSKNALSGWIQYATSF